MRRVRVSPVKGPFSLRCDEIAPDKSISHRCAMFALLSDRPSVIRNFLQAEDTLASLSIACQLGATAEWGGEGELTITPPVELREPDDVLDCGNAGTGMRLYCGLLAGVEGSFVLTGDRYLRARPMKRVTAPLQSVGAQLDGREHGNLAPLHIRGGQLKAFRYESPVDSAQVKSAMILAALRGEGRSYYRESFLSRDHTERMLSGMGARIGRDAEGWITIDPMEGPLKPLKLRVPADPSSAFFFAVAAAIVPGSEVVLTQISLNQTRIEAFRVLEQMGAGIEYRIHQDLYEPVGEITVRHAGRLRATEVSENIPWLIDELPALAVAMATAEGMSRVRNAEELRVKESDRIASTLAALTACGIETEEYPDGYAVRGGELHAATIDSHGDHRIAMSFAVAGLLCGMEIVDTDCVATSFPNFFEILSRITEVSES
ncbi:3-phosphoshikimate 1-carboxyvinyltransferase [Nitratifractor sp.]